MFRKLLPVPALLVAVAIAACGGNDDDASDPVETPPVPSPTAAPAAPAPSPTPEDAGPSPSDPLPSVQLERVFPDLAFERMTGLYQAPDSRWFVTEQAGRIQVFDEDGGAASVFLDISARVSTAGNEEGLLGFALAPDFADSGEFYVHYSAANPRRGVVSRFQAVGATADPASEAVIAEFGQPFANHNGGQIAFGPDGYLYIALGDGGAGYDPQGHGQNTQTLLGAVLRIDVSGGEAGYEIPDDNPFVGDDNVLDEIYAYGLRNPWRFSFDGETGDLWVADVGQDSLEAIHIVEAGGNYGWAIYEGTLCLDEDRCDEPGLEMPVFEYNIAGAPECAVTGGFVYRGEAIPELIGAYVYGDYCSSRIWALRYDGQEATVQAEIAHPDEVARISSFALDNAGELYVLDHGGAGGIYKIVP